MNLDKKKQAWITGGPRPTWNDMSDRQHLESFRNRGVLCIVTCRPVTLRTKHLEVPERRQGMIC